MTDNLTQEQRRKNMQAIRSKDSKIEIALRKAVWAMGMRYRKNCSKIIGKPDIAFIGKKIAVFCDGEFWHGYDWDTRKNQIKSRKEYWIPKIERNMQRDKEINAKLEELGWIVLRFWEKDIKKHPEKCADAIYKVWSYLNDG